MKVDEIAAQSGNGNRADRQIGEVGGAVSPPDSPSESASVRKDARLDPEMRKKIFKERARRLAEKRDEQDRDATCLQVIEFTLGHERYAAEVAYVGEVYPLKDLTPVPCAPSFVLGIMNVRGQVMSVLDVREFFDVPRKDITDLSRVLILKNHETEFGILADTVVGEKKITLDGVHADTSGITDGREDYIRGVTTDRLIVMNMERLLSDDKIVVHEEIGD